jgi:uncharacterized protein
MSGTTTETTLSPALQTLHAAIMHATHLLPAQGPINVFIHHNTLHAFEDMDFDSAVQHGAQVFGCEAYLPEARFRDELARGRIRTNELRAVLETDLGDAAAIEIAGLSTQLAIREALLLHPLLQGSAPELDWFMAESAGLLRMRQDIGEVQKRHLITETRQLVMRRLRGQHPSQESKPWLGAVMAHFDSNNIEHWQEAQWEAFTLHGLWEVCQRGVASILQVQLAEDANAQTNAQPQTATPAVRHRDALLQATGIDSDLLLNSILIPYCSAFLDQGVAHWNLASDEHHFYSAFLALHSKGNNSSAWWLLNFSALLAQHQALTALESIERSLQVLGVDNTQVAGFFSATLLTLRGWAGMLWHVEQRPDRVHHAPNPGTLVEYVAVRLLLEQQVLTAVAARHLSATVELKNLRQLLSSDLASNLTSNLVSSLVSNNQSSSKQQAFNLFQLAQILGWLPEQLATLTVTDWQHLSTEIETFGDLQRRRVFHLAYEHRFRAQTLDALASRKTVHIKPKGRPQFQAVFCLDEREESIRRHVEEAAPHAETFGAAGFFGVVMYYRSAAAADFTPLCPVVVRPQHWVSEVVDHELKEEAQRRKSLRRKLGMTLQNYHGGSRRILSGAFLSATVGLLTTVPLVLQVLYPRMTARTRRFLGKFIAPPPKTRLKLERDTPTASPHEQDHGFTLAEMLNTAERILRDLGLITNFARLVFFNGHGSTSMNNPHESAHDCGACGGGVGGPNARAIAHMLNDPRIRTGLTQRGISVPTDTHFVGCLHNTANDNITFFDTDQVPASHSAELSVAQAALLEAAQRNAHERARRFGSAPLNLSQVGAKHHMEGRSEDLSQVRPEWGHATNAICIVGRRERTRGLFLDRRAFLVSYDPLQDVSPTQDADPAQDTNNTPILARILGAAMPVCSGINLEYYFSHVDSPGWGAGSKLPHNITGLIGVMDGAMSDLRTGLPWQMVEIHEPVRLLFVIETTSAAMLAIMAQNAAINTMVRNKWVQVALQHPTTGELSLFNNSAFVPYQGDVDPLPVASNSLAWYGGWRERLEFAEITAALPQ